MKNFQKYINSFAQNTEKSQKSFTKIAKITTITSALISALCTSEMVNARENFPHSSIKSKFTSSQKDWQEYAHYLQGLSENQNFGKMFHALVKQESKWNHSAKSHTGAVGLAQITSVVFSDMHADFRKDLYLERLIALRAKNPRIFYRLPVTLHNLLMNLHKNVSDAHWEKIRQQFRQHVATDPHTNLLIGALVFDIIYDLNTSQKSGENFEKKMISELKKSGFNVAEFQKNFPKNANDKRLLEAVYHYNGNKNIVNFEGKKVPEKVAHTVKVLRNYSQ